MKRIDKRVLIAELRAQLEAEIAEMTRIAREAAEAAAHEENKPEGDKDMRSTEASYLARGQASRVLDLERANAMLGSLVPKDFGPDDPIESSALVELRLGKKTALYFLVSAAGGRKLVHEGLEIGTLTPTTPLGEALLGMSQGDDVEIESPQGPRAYEILSVA